jgi:hypothetical protein
MKYKIIHLFVKLTNLFQSKIVTTKVNKKIIFLFFIIAVIAMQLRTFTRFHWIIHDHVIHELLVYCQLDTIYRKPALYSNHFIGCKYCIYLIKYSSLHRIPGTLSLFIQPSDVISL